MKVYALSHVGRVRTTNEDSYYVPRPGEYFAVVADGMGGHRAGEVASHLAVEEFTRWLRCAPWPDEETLRYAASEANRAIYLKSKMEQDKAGMGTTLTALWVDEHRVYLTHVGDSRAYLLRDGKLSQKSIDHSLVWEMLKRGEITAEEARVHPKRNYITRALGISSQVNADISRFDRKKGDMWLLCSDGMSNYVKDDEIESILRRAGSGEKKVSTLVEMALKRGGADNITVLLILLDGGAA